MTPRVLEQLGIAYGYAPDGNGGPPILDDLAWGAVIAPGKVIDTPTPLFPRIESEAAESQPA